MLAPAQADCGCDQIAFRLNALQSSCCCLTASFDR
jgi:hypothetical protein